MKKDYSFGEIKEVFNDYLKKKNLRRTSERYAILEYIYMRKGHFDAEMLHTDMQNEYRVSLATVYNTLELLISCNLIVKHTFAGQTAQYEKTFGNSMHHHLVCSKCGAVKEFSDDNIRSKIQNKTFASFSVTHYSLYLYGICNNCLKKKPKYNTKKQP
ncbi:MAG: ferric uptake regulator, Fur family [Bacteroidetes bacterium]|jgi:Fur family ferric uptake transcriptional regulator|nr:ferric uptake regulator, Fur family [Bacteroidota bacterium]